VIKKEEEKLQPKKVETLASTSGKKKGTLFDDNDDG
jgi:hypothetical protein